MDWINKLTAQLDRDKPDWWIAWADHQDLMDLARLATTRERVKSNTAERLFHPILHAALGAGIVTETKES